MKKGKDVIAALSFFACSLLLSTLLPTMQDEAYYSVWGNHLQLGYYDHPPMVAWMAFLSRHLAHFLGIAQNSPLNERLVPSVLGTTLFLVMVRSIQLVTTRPIRDGVVFALVGGCLGILSASVLLTPDIALLFFAALAFHESLLALRGRLRRWYTAGIFLALACLAKYTAGLIILGPLFLLIKNRKKLKPQIATHLPHVLCGTFLFFLTCLPHVYWLSKNEWVSIRVQLNHGFTGKVQDASGDPQKIAPSSPSSTDICPTIVPADPEATAFLWSADFLRLQERLDKAAGRLVKPPEIELPLSLKILGREIELFSACLLVWGTLLFPLIAVAIKVRKKRSKDDKLSQTMSPSLQSYCYATAAGCIVFFSATAFFAKVEANWPMLYIIGGLPAIAAFLSTTSPTAKQARTIIIAGAFNVGLALVFLLRPSFFPARWYVRIDKENHGLKELAVFVSEMPKMPTLVDNYQLLAHLYRLSGSQTLGQWPTLNRNSEFTRPHQNLFPHCQNIFFDQSTFRYIGTEPPPVVGNFALTQLKQIRDCREMPVEVLDHSELLTNISIRPRCDDPLHAWFVGIYSRRKTP